MRRRVEGPGPTAWTTHDLLHVDEGIEADDIQPPVYLADHIPPPPSEPPKAPVKYHFVDYHTTLFSSQHLPVCFPDRLPPM